MDIRECFNTVTQLPVCDVEFHDLGEVDSRATVRQEGIPGEPNLLLGPDPCEPRLVVDLRGMEQPITSDRPITPLLLLWTPETAIDYSGFHHILGCDLVEFSHHVESDLRRFSIVSVIAKTNNHPPCMRVDLSHHVDMNTLLVKVGLVDAKCINPKMSLISFIPDLAQNLNEVCPHLNVNALAGNRANIIWAAPCVRYCFIFLNYTHISRLDYQSPLCLENRKSLPAD